MFAQAALRTIDDVNIAMTRVYQYMFLAVMSSMVTAYYVSITPALMAFFFTGIMTWVTILHL